MKYLLFILAFVLSLSMVNADSHYQTEILHFNFEQIPSSIVLDVSGQENSAVHVIGDWTQITGKFGQCIDLSGTFAFDVILDQATLQELTQYAEISGSFWFRPTNTPFVGTRTYLNMFAMNSSYELYSINDANESVPYQMRLSYIDVNQTTQDIHLFNYTYENDWQFIYIDIDIATNSLKYNFNDGSLQQVFAPTQFLVENLTYQFRYGTNKNFGNAHHDDLDEIRIFNNNLSQTQILDLYYFNNVELFTEPTTPPIPDIDGVEQIDLITNLSINEGDNVNLPFDLDVTLNYLSNCDIYINNDLVYNSEEEKLIHSYNINNLPTSNNNFLAYCYRLDNTTYYYNSTNLINFNVVDIADSEIHFYFSSPTVDLTEHPLYVITPCLRKGISVPNSGISEYSMRDNNFPVYFSEVDENGHAEFNLSTDEYQFCLIHGVSQYDNDTGYSPTWKINGVQIQKDLGTYNIPSNVQQAFAIGLSNEDLYKLHNPKHWGVSWTDIIVGILAFGLGAMLITIGAMMQIKGAIIGGVVLVMLGLGYQIPNFLLGVIT